ncbi:MAG: hypothetical protein H7A20_10705 [Rhodanobacteraceae bacterium]|mgnify:CR=1 FL=1|nr:hypothetical protein [Rhodanobacteraceae bacterium]
MNVTKVGLLFTRIKHRVSRGVVIVSLALSPVAYAGTVTYQLDPVQPLAAQPFEVVLPNDCLEFTGGYQVDYLGSTVRVTLDTPDVIFCQPGGPFPDLRVPVNGLPEGSYQLDFYGSNTSGQYLIDQSTFNVAAANRPGVHTVPSGNAIGWLALLACLIGGGILKIRQSTARHT